MTIPLSAINCEWLNHSIQSRSEFEFCFDFGNFNVLNINNLRYADYTTLMAESKEELKGLLMKVKEEIENVDLKLNIQITKIMASGLITSWQIDGETMETVADFI